MSIQYINLNGHTGYFIIFYFFLIILQPEVVAVVIVRKIRSQDLKKSYYSMSNLIIDCAAKYLICCKIFNDVFIFL